MGGTEAKPDQPAVTTVFRNPWVRFLGLLVLIFLGARVLYIIRGVLIPFTLAVIAAYIFDPVVDWLESRRIGKVHLSRGIAVGLLVVVFAALVGLFFFVAIPNAVLAAKQWLQDEKLGTVMQFLPEEWVRGLETWLNSTAGERRAIASRLFMDFFAQQGAADAVGQSLRTVVFSTFSALLWTFQFFLFFVVMVYLLIDIDRGRERVKDALPLPYKDEILRIVRQIDANLKSFFRGQVVVVLVLSCIFTAGLAIAGTPFWYVVGITGGLGAFVPYFALASGMVPALLLSAAQYQDLRHPVAVACVFAIGFIIDSTLVTPRVIGKSVGLHPVIIILSILVFGTLFGFLGVLFAVPIAAVVKVFAQELFARYRASEFYRGENGRIHP